MAEKPPAYQWYPKDFMSSSRVALMDLAEQGAYRRLLDHQWLSGSIPDDVEDLARLCGTNAREMSRIWRRVAPCFEPHPGQPGQLINPRLERQRFELEQFSAERASAGAKGAARRWQPRGSADGSATGSARPEPMATDGSADCSLRSADRPPLTPLRGRGERRRRRDAAPRRVVAAVESERFSRLWSAVRRGIGAKSWDDWFACCAPLDERDGVLVVGAPNVLVCEWLERTFRAVLDDLAAEHAPGVRVELRVAPPGQVAP